MNIALGSLYSSGFWLGSHHAKIVEKHMQTFLSAYQFCAHQMLLAKKRRFPIMPKCHFLAHLVVEMRRQCAISDWVQNPLGTSVQCQEDFIGRPSRVSRRVDVRKIHTNVIARCLILSEMALAKSDSDQRGIIG